jgi:PQQ-like domain
MIKWRKDISKPVMASPASLRDKVFFAASDQTIYCFKVKDGSDMGFQNRW